MFRTNATRTITLAGFAPAGKPKQQECRSLLWLACAVAAIAIAPAQAQTAASHASTVRIMTQNIDEGTDETFIVEALFGYMPLPDAVDLTYA